MKRYTVLIQRDPEEAREVYNATVPALPGCLSWGNSVAEAVKNIQEAIDLYVGVMLDEGQKLPRDVKPSLFLVEVDA